MVMEDLRESSTNPYKRVRCSFLWNLGTMIFRNSETPKLIFIDTPAVLEGGPRQSTGDDVLELKGNDGYQRQVR
jgi:hypothetical protein